MGLFGIPYFHKYQLTNTILSFGFVKIGLNLLQAGQAIPLCSIKQTVRLLRSLVSEVTLKV